ncbi:glycosyltransferase family 2 protein [Spirulina major]|uniref:glycosyltransferase family 2 protein n=1 Tax=Spirulina major TaxID=270636 RepID=UPI000934F1C5|nr:glycosyltransferase family 2 protein [Spirulina major]
MHYSFIIPVYNEESTLPELVRRLTELADRLDAPCEFLFVDDGSSDRTLPLLRQTHTQDPRFCYLSFARNFGHQLAVTAGLNHVSGDVITVLDGDLQDPPELVIEMIDQWRAGYQVVYAQRIKRHQEHWLKRFYAYLFYRLLKRLADVDIPTDTGDFCLMDRQVVDVFNAMPERNRYLRGLRAWIGFKQTAVQFERDSRFAGDRKYTFRKSFSLALNGLVSFSRVPLRLATYTGLLAGLFSLLMAGLVFYWRFFGAGNPLVGIAAIMIAVFFLGAVQLVSIGILGEYIGRIYEEVKGRPLYILSEVAGVEGVRSATQPTSTTEG